MSSLEEIEKRRADRKAKLEEERTTQKCLDVEALDLLEQEHGDNGVAFLEVDRYVQGLPTIVVIKAPDAAQYKRFAQQVRTAQNKESQAKAQDLLAESVWIYPSADADKAKMRECFPGILPSIAIRATKLVELRSEEEGKG